ERPDFHGHLRSYWKEHIYSGQRAADRFDEFWDHTVQAGFFEFEAPRGKAPAFSGDIASAARAISRTSPDDIAADTPVRCELHLSETVAIRDGRHANNPWLQELPDPITKLTWGHALALAPSTADRLRARDGDVIAITADGVRVELPALRQPGQA